MHENAELTLAVRGATLAVQDYRLRAARAGFGVGATEMMTLSQLYTNGPQSPSDLARFLSVTTASMTELVDRLERGGHVSRRPHATDRRRILVDLNPEARATIDKMFVRAEQISADAARSLTAAERRSVLRFLQDVAEGYARTDPTA